MPITDPTRYLTRNEYDGHTVFDFPNGIHVSVIPDPRWLFDWELLAERDGVGADHDRLDPAGLASGLSSEQVRALLAEIANLPHPDDVAWANLQSNAKEV